MARPGSSLEENPVLGSIVERVLPPTLELAQQSSEASEAARFLRERLEGALNLGEFEQYLAIAVLSERVLALEERLARLEGR